VRIQSYLTDEAVLSELGRNLTQRELAAQAGVERKAVQRMEGGEPVKLTSFVRVLRALGLLEALEQLVPEPVPSPIELLKLHGKERRRASGERGARARARARSARTRGERGQGERAQGWQAWGERAPDQQDTAWQWGDETADDAS
jgi:transcriptional regulator with XRE-family HTH domain